MQHAGRMSQAELARRLTNRLRREYDRSMIHKLLKGERELSAAELLAVAAITGFALPLENAANPERPSIDAILRDTPDDVVREAAEIATILVKRAG